MNTVTAIHGESTVRCPECGQIETHFIFFGTNGNVVRCRTNTDIVYLIEEKKPLTFTSKRSLTVTSKRSYEPEDWFDESPLD